MSRYDLGGEGEEAFEPGSEGLVLRNKLGIKSEQEVNLFESNLLVAAQIRSTEEVEDSTVLTVKLIRGFHRSWLSTLYAFAGEIRTVNLGRETSSLRR